MQVAKIALKSFFTHFVFSGCVTSAETLLIQEQSFEKLLQKLREVDMATIIVIISPNSRASIADYLHLSPSETFLRIATVLKSLGIRYVFDASSAGDIALLESREEFMMR
jgi:iron only hydrogenase large subunit-like protein